MATGLERRGEVRDQANIAGQAVRAGSVPVPGQMFVAPAKVTGGNDTLALLASAADFASGAMREYEADRNEAARVDGAMQYMSGVEEAKIREAGDKYSIEGFSAMKAATAANEFAAAQYSALESEDYALTPEQYREKLNNSVAALQEAVAGSDEYTKKMLVSSMDDIFPRLAAGHTKLHNQWRKQQTFDSAVGMMQSIARRPDYSDEEKKARLAALNDPAVTGLPKDMHDKAVAQAAISALEMDSPHLAELLIGRMPDVETSAKEARLGLPMGTIAAVRKIESVKGDYNEDGSPVVSSAGAMFGMQVLPKTAAQPGYGVKPAAAQTPEEYNRVGEELLGALYNKYNGDMELALMAYNWGPGAVNEWVANGRDPNKVPEQTKNYLVKFANLIQKSEVGGGQTGVSSVVQSELLQRYDAYKTKKASEFSIARVNLEDAIINEVASGGTILAARERIMRAAEEHNLPNSWAEQMNNQAVATAQTYQKSLSERTMREQYAEMGALSELSPVQQRTFFSEKRAQLTEMAPENAPEHYVDMQMATIAANSGVIDPFIAGSIRLGLNTPPLTPDGGADPAFVSAYEKAKVLKNAVSDKLFREYLGDTAETFYDLDLFAESSGGHPVEAARYLTALRTGGGAKVKPDVAMIRTQITEQLTPSLLESLGRRFFSNSPRTATVPRSEADIATVAADPILRRKITALASKLAATSNRPVESVIKQATSDVLANTEVVLGKPLVGEKASIRRVMGIPEAESEYAVEDAIVSYVGQYAKELFGNALEGTTFSGFGSAVGARERRVSEDAIVRWDDDSRTFLVSVPLKRKESIIPGITYTSKDWVYSAPVPISAEQVGKFWRDSLTK